MINAKTELLCLIGSPVSHSFSPAMHNAGLEKMNINASYMAFDVEEDHLKTSIKGLKALNFKGANVTIPHKTTIMSYLDWIDPQAKIIGAVNTIVYKDNVLRGYNTDALGFSKSLEVSGVNVENGNVAVLGTGGAAKAVVAALINNKVASIDIMTRLKVKGNDFIKPFEDEICEMKAYIYDEFDYDKAYDLIINTTPLGMGEHIESSPLNTRDAGDENTVFYDLIYNPIQTVFLKEADETNRKTISGLSMLIHQGLLALELWYGSEILNGNWDENRVLDTLKRLDVI